MYSENCLLITVKYDDIRRGETLEKCTDYSVENSVRSLYRRFIYASGNSITWYTQYILPHIVLASASTCRHSEMVSMLTSAEKGARSLWPRSSAMCPSLGDSIGVSVFSSFLSVFAQHSRGKYTLPYWPTDIILHLLWLQKVYKRAFLLYYFHSLWLSCSVISAICVKSWI